jgi:hypothetical protein
MSKTLRVSDETFQLFDQVREILGIGSDRMVRYGLEAMFPGILDRGDVQGDDAVIMRQFGEFIGDQLVDRDEWDGFKRSKK